MPLASTPRALSALADRLDIGQRRAVEAVRKIACDAGTPAYLVGGPVRDFLLGATVLDLDFSVEGDALRLAGRLADLVGGNATTYPRFGTATVTFEGTRVDLVTARREAYPEQGRLPKVAPSDIADDLARRDFTINAMALPLSELASGVIDHWNGQNDLQFGIIRILHPESFVDDPTRMFRAVRYEQRFGFRIEHGTRARITSAISAGCMDSVSGDRWRHEVEKILDEPNPGPALLRASELGLLSGLHPALAKDAGLRNLSSCPEGADGADEWLAALFAPLTESEGVSVIDRLRLSGRKAALARDTINVREAESAIKRASRSASDLYRLLSTFDPVALSLNAKISTDPLISNTMRYYLDELRAVQAGISGDELLDMGATPGPVIGKILSQLQDAWLDGQVSNTDEERALARVLVARSDEGSAKQLQ